MKNLIVLLFLFYVLPEAVQAQAFTKEVIPSTISLKNTPSGLKTTSLLNTSFNVKPSNILPSQNSFIFSSLELFEGLKFNSLLDQFASIPMFDSRAYKPTSVSNYNNYLHRNYLILNSSFPKAW